MTPVADAEERFTVNKLAEAPGFPRVPGFRGLPVAVAAMVALGTPLMVTGCSSHAAVGSVCSFVVDHTTSCDSTNPKVEVSGYFTDDTSGCTFVRNIDWGDGTTSDNAVVHGGSAGPAYAGSHTYSAPGSYAIYFGGYVQGNCTIDTPTFHFKLLTS